MIGYQIGQIDDVIIGTKSDFIIQSLCISHIL